MMIACDNNFEFFVNYNNMHILLFDQIYFKWFVLVDHNLWSTKKYT